MAEPEVTTVTADGIRHRTFRDTDGFYVTVSRRLRNYAEKAKVTRHQKGHPCPQLAAKYHAEFMSRL